MTESKNNITQNKYLSDLNSGLKLITDLISAKVKLDSSDELLLSIRKKIYEGFIELSDNDLSPKSSVAFNGLQKLYEDLLEIASFPSLENKNIVAVGGAFSAGKSKFLNSILNQKKLLPIGTLETTSIPTYLLAGKQDSINSLNMYQNLIQMDAEALHAITHSFNESYGVTFSHILKLITIERVSIPFKNIVFLDTPGYSKDDTHKGAYDNTDKNIAKEHLRKADALIWLIDVETGTVSAADIQFIKALNLNGTPLLVVFNKAERKTPKQLQGVIDLAQKTLYKNNIKFYDVVGYSSNLNKEYSENKTVLAGYLESIDKVKPGTNITADLKRIFKLYLNYHSSQKEFAKDSRKFTGEKLFDGLNEEESTKMRIIDQRIRKQIEILKASEDRINNFANELSVLINKLLLAKNIRVVGSNAVRLKVKEFGQSVKTNFEFDAFGIKPDKLSMFNDFNNIIGSIRKKSSIGITIAINEETDAFISFTRLSEKIGSDWLNYFNVGDKVKLQYVGKDKAIAKIELIY